MKTNVQTGNRYNQLTDNALIPLALSGQQEAFTALVRRHDRLLRFVLQRYLTDPEAVQEVINDTFIRAFRGLSAFRGDSKFSTWLCKIATSQAITRLRTRRYATWESLDDAVPGWQDDAHYNELPLERQETGQLLRKAVRQLHPNDAIALELFYFREQSIEEMRQITGWSVTNIKSRLFRARQRLQDILAKEGYQAAHFA